MSHRFSIQDGSAMAGNNSDAEAFDRSHCVYSGTVTGTSSDSKPITGEAVLSACNVHEGLVSNSEIALRSGRRNLKNAHFCSQV